MLGLVIGYLGGMVALGILAVLLLAIIIMHDYYLINKPNGGK